MGHSGLWVSGMDAGKREYLFIYNYHTTHSLVMISK